MTVGFTAVYQLKRITIVIIEYALLPPTKEEVHVFARVCLSVCLLARLLKTRAWIWMNGCVSTDVGT